MELDDKTYNEYDAVYRYKKSILFDSFICFVLFAPVLFLFARLIQEYEYLQFLIVPMSLLLFSVYFLSDMIFKGASIGKRVFKIKLVSRSKNMNVSTKSIVYRRFLEVWIHPSFTKMNFLEKSRYIDKQTGTKIIKSNEFETN